MKDRSFCFYRFCRSQSLHSQYLFPIALAVPVLSPAIVGTSAANAQSITAAEDATGTVVTESQTGLETQFDITGGSFSADGINQFHSFDSFSVEAGQTANFVAEPSVQNVLARVNGGAPSVVNGQVQIEGIGQPDLFLMNPAGILIGPDAHLNLPGSLTVTTADAISFDQDRFYAVGDNTYTALSRSPTAFVFESDSPGSIVTEGNLSVTSNGALTLLGGTVANTGELSAPGGAVTLAAVPGESTVKITQSNHLLSLEVTPTPVSSTAARQTITPLELPSLLTAGDQHHADSLSINSDGSVTLSSRGPTPQHEFSVQAGSAVSTGQIMVTANSTQPSINSTTTDAAITDSTATDSTATDLMGGSISILGEEVALVDATLSASGRNGGGTINIGGAYKGSGLLPSASYSFVDGNTQISADATDFGNGGQVIVWADDTTQYLGDISATGGMYGGDGGFVEVSGKETLVFQGFVDTSATAGKMGSLLLDPENIFIVDSVPADNNDELLDARILADEGSGTFEISAAALEDLAADTAITLEATNDIIVQNLLGNTLTFPSGTGSITLRADADNSGAGDLLFMDINDSVTAPGRSLNFSGQYILVGNLSTVAPGGGGAVTLQSNTAVRARNIDTYATTQGDGGNVTIEANNNIVAEFIRTESPSQVGDISINSQTGSINIRNITTNSNGNVSITAPGNSVVQGLPLPDFINTLPATNTTEPPAEPATNLLTNEILEAQLALLGTLGSGVDVGAAASSATASDSGEAEQYGVQRKELSSDEASAALAELNGESHQVFSDYFERDLETTEMSLEDVQALLATMERSSGSRSAVVYVQVPAEPSLDEGSLAAPLTESSSNEITLLLFTAEDAPVQVALPNVQKENLLSTVNDLRSDLITSARRGSDYYLAPAQQLYDWLLAPIEADLASANIDTLVFAMDEGVRTLPIAALHDGESFLAEKYSLGMVPSLGMLDTHYAPLAKAQVLAMGISDFNQYEGLAPLPGVPLEVDAISQIWPGAEFLNEQFTRQSLVSEQQQRPYNIIHLATHAEFKPGSIDNSFVQLWDEKLLLSDLPQLGWQSPAVDLLVLSACNTALGSPEAEMGFAGLAIASGARSAMASLWSVDDIGTLALMNEFYAQLKDSPTKSAALQRAQLALLQGDIRTESGRLVGSETGRTFSLPTGIDVPMSKDFSHPYYWSSFTMIGSPW